MPQRDALKHSKAGLAQSLLGVTAPFVGPGVHKVFFAPLSTWQVCDLILNPIVPLLLSCWGSSFATECGVYLLGGLRHFLVDRCPAASCDFGAPAE